MSFSSWHGILQFGAHGGVKGVGCVESLRAWRVEGTKRLNHKSETLNPRHTTFRCMSLIWVGAFMLLEACVHMKTRSFNATLHSRLWQDNYGLKSPCGAMYPAGCKSHTPGTTLMLPYMGTPEFARGNGKSGAERCLECFGSICTPSGSD